MTTVILTVYAQIVIKWQVNNVGELPIDAFGKLTFLTRLLLNPWVISAFLSVFLGSVTWMAALTKLELSQAYPFVGLTFAIILVLSSFFFQETITMNKIIGISLVVLGIVIGNK